MLVKVFITGLPGSGKSTAYRSIFQYVEELNQDWHVLRINDYDILRAMCVADTERKKFRWTKHKGFNVKDFSVLNDALGEARTRIEKHRLSAANELIVIEFARNDYRNAFQVFGKDILQDAYFLFLEVKKSNCSKRLKERITKLHSPDNHYVSISILRTYYHKGLQYTSSDLKTDYGINDQNIFVINNNGQEADLVAQIEQFVGAILAWEVERNTILDSTHLPNSYAYPQNSSDMNTTC
jgi:adenylate kinase family enzyme